MIPQGSLVTTNDVQQTWRTSGGKPQRGTPTRTDFPPELVAQLREAMQKPAPKPWRKSATAEPVAAPEAGTSPTAVNTTTPAQDTPSPALAPSSLLPIPTMVEVEGGNLAEKNAFVRRHFPTWLAYQAEHGLSRSKMLALTGLASSVWVHHKNLYAAHPERYGEAPATSTQTVVLGAGLALPEVLAPLSPTAVGKVQAFMLLAQELRQMGATVQASVSWQVDVTL
jgi:hypothetical protein